MFTRRTVMTMIGAAVLQVAPPRPDQRAWAQSGSQAVTFVKSTSEQLVAIVNGVATPQESTNGCRRLSTQRWTSTTSRVSVLAASGASRPPISSSNTWPCSTIFLVTKIASHLGEYARVCGLP